MAATQGKLTPPTQLHQLPWPVKRAHQTRRRTSILRRRVALKTPRAYLYSPTRVTAVAQAVPCGELGWPTNLNEHFELGSLIGAGSYGIVRLSLERANGREVAIKVLSKKRGSQARPRILRKLAREVDLLTRLQDSCNVVQLLSVYEDSDNAYLVCELCRGGDLERILTDRGPFSECAAARVLYEALKMVAACHANNVIHGDVKPANFLLRQHQTDPLGTLERGNLSGAWMKSVDFGCSQVVLDGQRLTRRTGTPVYMAPEIFERSYGLESDMWSLGMMFYQLTASRFPFWSSLEECRNKSVGEVMQTVVTGSIPLDYGPWLSMSSAGLDLMRAFTHREPECRITAKQALQHPWFKQQLQSRPPALPQRSNIIPKVPRKAKSGSKVLKEPTPDAGEVWLRQMQPSLVPL